VTASRPRLGISTASWLIKSDTPQPTQHRVEIRRERREEHRIIQQCVYPRQLLRKMQQLNRQLRLPRRHRTAYSAKHGGLDHF
jgi:hypothetical protein